MDARRGILLGAALLAAALVAGRLAVPRTGAHFAGVASPAPALVSAPDLGGESLRAPERAVRASSHPAPPSEARADDQPPTQIL